MDLHYSQTDGKVFRVTSGFTTLWIYTILKRYLGLFSVRLGFTTLWIYTILKRSCAAIRRDAVLLPYGFTLFSNAVIGHLSVAFVLLPYGFTLFSNIAGGDRIGQLFYYLMDLHYSQTYSKGAEWLKSFTTLWIYTILKLFRFCDTINNCFTTLWIYTILKQKFRPCILYQVLLPYGFTLFSNNGSR